MSAFLTKRAFFSNDAYTRRMQLRGARLCLDCEELHSDDRCPVCASGAFAFLTRWVPSDERRRRDRLPSPQRMATPKRIPALVKRGSLGLALFAVVRWVWRSTAPTPSPAPRQDSRNIKAPGDGLE